MIGFNKFLVQRMSAQAVHLGNVPHSLLSRDEAVNLCAFLTSVMAIEPDELRGELEAFQASEIRRAGQNVVQPAPSGPPQAAALPVAETCPKCGSGTFFIDAKEICKVCGGYPIVRGAPTGVGQA